MERRKNECQILRHASARGGYRTLTTCWGRRTIRKSLRRLSEKEASSSPTNQACAPIRMPARSEGMKGTTPVVKTTGARFGFNMLSAVSAPREFRLYDRRTSGDCGRLFRVSPPAPAGEAPQDRAHRVWTPHAQSETCATIYLHAGRSAGAEVLSPYSTDLNPDKLAWAHGKTKLGRGATRTKTELRPRGHSILRSLQQRPSLDRPLLPGALVRLYDGMRLSERRAWSLLRCNT